MKMNDMILVSVDDHIIEPPNMFKQHLPRELIDKAPTFISKDGKDCWVFEGRTVYNIGLNAVVGRPREEYGCEPESLQHMRAGTYDIKKRIDDMNVNGLLGSLCFGTFVSFDGSYFMQSKDMTLALRMLQAYNDWHIDEWCASAPGRFIPMAIVPLWDVNLVVEEVKRVVKKGCRAISFPDNPAAKGLPSIHNKCWEPLWKLCNDEKVVINCHIGSGYLPPHPSMESSINCWITTMPISIANAAGDWIHLEAFARYPDLKIALSEGGIGWIPYLLERADFTFKHHTWTNTHLGGMLPSELFRKHFITCFIDDRYGLKNYKDIGEDLICYECDYPHSDTAVRFTGKRD
jgi:predicted TIM-barrel fold metal-dependent hydrolase